MSEMVVEEPVAVKLRLSDCHRLCCVPSLVDVKTSPLTEPAETTTPSWIPYVGSLPRSNVSE